MFIVTVLFSLSIPASSIAASSGPPFRDPNTSASEELRARSERVGTLGTLNTSLSFRVPTRASFPSAFTFTIFEPTADCPAFGGFGIRSMVSTAAFRKASSSRPLPLVSLSFARLLPCATAPDRSNGNPDASRARLFPSNRGGRRGVGSSGRGRRNDGGGGGPGRMRAASRWRVFGGASDVDGTGASPMGEESRSSP